MYTSISGSGRPSLGVCSLDYAGELHKRGIQRVKVRLRGGGDASARGDFRVPFPGDTLASCEPWKRGVTNVSFFLSFFFSQYWNNFVSTAHRPFSIYWQLELPEGVSEIKGSLSLFSFAFVSFFSLYFSSLSLSLSLFLFFISSDVSFFIFWFFGFHPWRNVEGFLPFNLTL